MLIISRSNDYAMGHETKANIYVKCSVDHMSSIQNNYCRQKKQHLFL